MRDETKMDANRLITEVYKRPALWNKKNIYYHNRDVTNRIWMEIADIFKLPKQVLKTKWKGLRDTFRAELKKEEVYRKSNYTPNRPIWMHFKTLQFLKEQMLPRPPIWERSNNSCENVATSAASGTSDDASDLAHARVDATGKVNKAEKTIISLDSKEREGVASPHCDSRVDFIDSIKADDLSSSAITNSPNSHHSDSSHLSYDDNDNNNSSNDNKNVDDERETSATVKEEIIDNYEVNIEEFGNVDEEINNFNDKISTILEKNISNEAPVVSMIETTGDNCVNAVDPLEDNHFDDNYYFFMSLLPHIRTLPAERRMLLRMQMQQLVYQEVYKRNRPVRSSFVVASEQSAHDQQQP